MTSGSGAAPRYCDVALPVPLDQLYTYEVPEALAGRVLSGARVLAPFGARRLTGVAIACHDDPPAQRARALLKLLDDQPALPEELLRLARWISGYYAAPLGETLRAMLPLGGEMRSGKTVALTEKGAEAAARFAGSSAEDPAVRLLRLLEKRPLSLAHLKRRVSGAEPPLRRLEQQGFVAVATNVEQRDPLRARDGRLVVCAAESAEAGGRLTKAERWLLDYVRERPGEHDVESLAVERSDAATVARRLARRGLVHVRVVRGRPVAAADSPRVELNTAQRAAFDSVAGALTTREYQAFLLHGVTGSGKTEVYLRAIEAALAVGRGALLLVPEIGLTPAVAGQFFGRFGDCVAILHSAFSGWQRAEQWRRIRSGEARVVIGTRSAVFAPVRDLGLVVVDEEQEAGYKQDETPRYHGRDVAVMRARQAGAVALLGSATPSVESRRNVDRGKYELLELPDRVEGRPMPEIEVVDMRREFVETRQNDLLSRSLVHQIETQLAAGRQAMILLNRRGWAIFALCRACGSRVECQNCSVALAYHRRAAKLLCHYCDYSEPVPERCPTCDSDYVSFQGSGSQKVEDALRERFPRTRIARLDRDSVQGRDRYSEILHGFRDGAYDILVGTQMIAKGHDVPNVTLVGVISADVGLGLPDFRAAERTFQLLTQAAGRAGRGDRPGKVVLQTMNPEHYAVRFAAAQDYAGFLKKELRFRRLMHYPPFTALATLLVRSPKLEEALGWTQRLTLALQDLPSQVRLLGPAPAPVARLKRDYRYQFLLKASDRATLAAIVRRARNFAAQDGWGATALVIDVDPVSLL